jgi:hypothetical protein
MKTLGQISVKRLTILTEEFKVFSVTQGKYWDSVKQAINASFYMLPKLM